MITVNTRLTEVETTQTADQTAFTNQIATINTTLTNMQAEITTMQTKLFEIEISNGFFNQF